ncbi:MAG: F0F1 ATP synthase subunit epsilon [Desulfovibrio sp.]|jgi:F-type H+-transporting ATPase subunit epsilon|nr:F0F1 ATP synthase subunit epsilon [Desulfovibrio sp.]
MAALRLDIVTPDCVVLSKDVEYVGAPGLLGEFGVLPGHIPFISALSVGVLHYKREGKSHYVFVSGGFAEVSEDTVTVLAESAEQAHQIDFSRAEEARKRAQARLDAKNEDHDFKRASFALARSVSRLSLRGRD